MPNRAIFFILFVIAFLNNINAQIYLELEEQGELTFPEIVKETEAYFDIVGRDRGKGYTPFRRWKYWSERSLGPDQKIISKETIDDELRRFNRNNTGRLQKSISGNYREMGPLSATNTSTWSSHIGRVSAIGVDPNNDNHIIVGSPTGGVWRTTNKGSTWTVLTDNENNIDIWSLAISHSNANKYIAGTGVGIRYSLDAGVTWQNAQGEPSAKANTILIDPTNSNTVYAVFESAGEIYKSTDGAINWTLMYNHNDAMFDLEFKPGQPSTLYASGRGIVLKSTNFGNSFTVVNGPWTSTGAMMMAVTADDSDYLYVLQEFNGGFGALYRSTDGGSSFSIQSDDSCDCNNIMGYNQSQKGGQAPRDMDVIVSPSDKDEVHVAGVETWKAIDGGMTWNKATTWLVNGNLPFIHADIDLLQYIGNTIYAGTDGGIFYSTNSAQSYTDITQGLGIRQFYRIGVSETDIDRVSGGSQDNGTGLVRSDVWYDFMGADGMETFIDYSDENIVYGSVQFGLLYKSTDGGNTASTTTQTPGGNGVWVTPLMQDPVNPNTVYQGKFEVYKSIDGANTWTAISNFNNGELLREMAIAPTDNNRLYVSFNDELFTTADGGATWTDITPNHAISRINYINVHPTNPNRLSLIISGNNNKILESFDAGLTWESIHNNLPVIAANTVVYEGDGNGGMYIGMNPGIYYKNDFTGGTWSNVTGNLPLVRIAELEVRNDNLYVGTYGRGLWKVGLSTTVLPTNLTCSTAQELRIECGHMFASIAPSSNGGASQNDATHSSWYMFIPELSGEISVSSCGLTSEDTRLWIHAGTSCNTLSVIGSDDNSCGTQSEVTNVPVTAGVPIYIEWDDIHSSNGFDFMVEYTGGFTCSAAEGIQTAGIYTAPDIKCIGASHADASGAIWYEYTPTANGSIDVYSCNGGIDTRLWIYSGTCGNLTVIGQSDDVCPMGAGLNNWASEVLDIPVLNGVPIYIEWDDRWSTSGFDWHLDFEEEICTPSYSGMTQLTGGQSVDADYEASGVIDSDQVIGMNAVVDYDSGSEINLLEGFEVQLGAIFQAFIDGCGNLLTSGDETDQKK